MHGKYKCETILLKNSIVTIVKEIFSKNIDKYCIGIYIVQKLQREVQNIIGNKYFKLLG